MKAFLLAAGLGTRLRPITDRIPKCLVPICGKPLLGWWIDLLLQHGISEVLINLHHFPEQVRAFLDSCPRKPRFTCVYEPKLLGSAGTLRANREFVAGERSFFVLYADNLTNYDLSAFQDFHRQTGHQNCMALFQTPVPSQCGIVELDEQQRVVAFEEKPAQPRSNLANAGLYLFRPAMMDLIPALPVTDIGYHLLPQLIGQLHGWLGGGFLVDIGSPAQLQRAENEWPAGNPDQAKAKNKTR